MESTWPLCLKLIEYITYKNHSLIEIITPIKSCKFINFKEDPSGSASYWPDIGSVFKPVGWIRLNLLTKN